MTFVLSFLILAIDSEGVPYNSIGRRCIKIANAWHSPSEAQ
jgi:hypothetical protein